MTAGSKLENDGVNVWRHGADGSSLALVLPVVRVALVAVVTVVTPGAASVLVSVSVPVLITCCSIPNSAADSDGSCRSKKRSNLLRKARSISWLERLQSCKQQSGLRSEGHHQQ